MSGGVGVFQVGTAGATTRPRRGTQCAALFNDGTGPAWYRAKVLAETPVGIRVQYIDHGNCATVPTSKLRPLDPSYFSIKPQARFVKPCVRPAWRWVVCVALRSARWVLVCSAGAVFLVSGGVSPLDGS